MSQVKGSGTGFGEVWWFCLFVFEVLTTEELRRAEARLPEDFLKGCPLPLGKERQDVLSPAAQKHNQEELTFPQESSNCI